jgi:tetratricopeptide (TPR) repeat protein
VFDLKQPHLDDFALLCYVAGDLDEAQRSAVQIHLSGCQGCRATLTEIERLDKELTLLAKDAGAHQYWYPEELPAKDPFRRPPAAWRKRPAQTSLTMVERVAGASVAAENAAPASDAMLEAVKDPRRTLTEILSRSSLATLTDRFALLYALQEAGQQIAETPLRFRAFAEEVISVLGGSVRRQAGPDSSEAERVVPSLLLRAQAHQLAGQARLWTGEFEDAGLHFRSAYRAFGLAGDETGTARVEQLEAQRRFFIGHGEEALVLARRAAATFAMLNLEDELARCRGAAGMALFQLGRWQESVEAFRSALGAFEAYELWSNYVGTLNSVATALVKMGRLDEARREYAKALRKLSREQHRSWLPFIRKGLAEVLFSARRYREAATQASRAAGLFAESGQVSRFLVASLFEAESWARAGDLGRARHRLELFRTEVARQTTLDPTLEGLIEQALSGKSSDFREIGALREHADAFLKDRFGAQV